MLNTLLICNGTNSFISNTAQGHAGAIYTENTVLIVKGANDFINNSAGSYGGAISTYNTDVFGERVRNKSTEKNPGSSWDLNPRPSEY